MINVRTIKTVTVFLFLIISVFLLCSSGIADEPSLSTKEVKEREGYVLNLKDLIKKSKSKIDRVNSKLKEQARRRRNQKREEKSREYYEKAMILFEEGKLEAAASLWRKSIRITEHPEMKGYIRESVVKTKKATVAFAKEEMKRIKRLEEERGYSSKDVEKEYRRGVMFFKDKKYIEAKNAFEEVEMMFPDHKATRSYIMIIGQEIEKEQKDLIENKLRDETIAQVKEKDAWKKNLLLKEKKLKEKQMFEADALYLDAIKLYKNREFESAKNVFKKLEWKYPGYKGTVKYLQRIDKHISRQQSSDEVKYAEDLFTNKKHRVTAQRDTNVKELKKLESAKKAEVVRKKIALEEEVKFVYDAGVVLYEKGSYEESEKKFLEVNDLLPKYKNTNRYISKISKKLRSHKKKGFFDIFKKAQKEPSVEASPIEVFSSGEVLNNDHPIAVLNDVSQSISDKALYSRRQQFEAEASQKYLDAVSLYQSRNFYEAKMKFIQVEALYPGYKNTRQYLSHIDEDVASVVDVENKLAMSGTSWNSNTFDYGLDSEGSEESSYRMDIDDIYEQGVTSYRRGDYDLALEKFEKVKIVNDSYRAVDKYLIRIQKEDPSLNVVTRTKSSSSTDEVPNESLTKRIKFVDAEYDKGDIPSKAVDVETADKVERMYQEAIILYKAKQYLHARDKFENVDILVPSYLKTEKYLDKIASRVERQKKDFDRKRVINVGLDEGRYSKEFINEVEVSYQEAVNYYKSKQFMMAKDKFIEVTRLMPDHKKATRYINKIDRIVRRKREYSNREIKAGNTIEEWKKKAKRIDQNKIISDESLKEFEWNLKQDEMVALLKAQEEQRDRLKLEEYKEFKKDLDERKMAVKKLSEERKLYDKMRAKEIKQRLFEEEQAVREEKKEAKRLDREAIAETKRLQKEKRIAKRFEEEKKLIEERRRVKAIAQKKIIDSETDIKIEQLLRKREEKEKKIKEKESKKKNSYEKIELRKTTKEEFDLERKRQKELRKKQKDVVSKQAKEVSKLLAREARKEKKKFRKRFGFDIVKKPARSSKVSNNFLDNGKNESSSDNPALRKIDEEIDMEIMKQILAEENVSAKKSDMGLKTFDKYSLRDLKTEIATDKAKKERLARLREEKIRERKEAKERALEDKRRLSEEKKKKNKKDKHKRKNKKTSDKKSSKDNESKILKEVPGVDQGNNLSKKDLISDESLLVKENIADDKEIDLLKKENARALKSEKRKKEKQELLARKLAKKEDKRRIKEERIATRKAEKENRANERILKKEEEKKKLEEKAALEEERKVKREEEKRERLRQDAASRLFERDMDRIYEQAIGFVKRGKYEYADIKFNKFQKMLTDEKVPDKYYRKMTKKLVSDRRTLDKLVEKELTKKEEIARKREIQVKKEKKNADRKKEKELKRLESEIAAEERKLETEKQSAKLALLRKEKLRNPGNLNNLNNPKNNFIDGDDIGVMKSESDLVSLVRERQKEINEEREKIRLEFSNTINDLYNKAVGLFQKGFYTDAMSMFLQINEMSPGFKGLKGYLGKIDAINKSKEHRDASAVKNNVDVVRYDEPAGKRQNVISKALDIFESGSGR